MGGASYYQINYPSKQFKFYFSTLQSDKNVQLKPYWVTGFTDAEGTLTIVIDKVQKRKLGWRIQSKFQICLHVRDLPLLLKIQQFFRGIGSVSISGDLAFYSVSSVKDLVNIIVPHFLNYPLLTQKGADFILFKQIVELMDNRAHLTIEGFNKIINIKAVMNLGLSDSFKYDFKELALPLVQLRNELMPAAYKQGKQMVPAFVVTNVTIERPLIQTEIIPDPNWISGFVDGEGTFDIKIYSSKTNVGFAVQLRFRIPQHERDSKLIELIMKYFGSGSIEKHTRHPAITLVINKFSTVIEQIIPFFESYPLKGVKFLDYLDWCNVAKIMSNKAHLTQEGLNLIRTIKSGMNKGREK